MSDLNKSYKVYLCGKMGGLSFDQMNGWRQGIKKTLKNKAEQMGYNVLVVNPVDYYNYENVDYQSDREVENYDLRHVFTSDFIIVNLKGLNTSIGTAIELHYAAHQYHIPILGWGTDKEYNELHPWIKGCISRYEHTAVDLMQYISDFYFIT